MARSGQIEKDVALAVNVALAWQIISQSEEDNTSTLQWTLKYVNDAIASGTYTSASIYTTINGEIQNWDIGEVTVPAGESVTLKTFTTVIPHNTDRTKTFSYSFNGSVKWAFITENVNASGTAELDLTPEKAKITSAPDFNDEGYPKITYNNRMGLGVSSLQAGIEINGKMIVPYEDVDKTGADSSITTYLSHDFNLSSTVRANLRKEFATTVSSLPATFYLKTVYNGQTYIDSVQRTVSLINHTPRLNHAVMDSNTRTVDLTDDPTKFIKGFSTATYRMYATAYKGATIVSQSAQCGQEIQTTESGAFENISSNTIYYAVEDSRGHIARDFTVLDMVPYIPLTASLTTGLIGPTGELTFTVKGQYFDGSFGKQRNSMQLQYSVRDENGEPVFGNNEDDGGWVEMGEITPSVENGNYTFTHTITGLESDEGRTYELEVWVNDALSPRQSIITTIAALPNFDWSKDDFHHHTDVVFSNNKRIIGTTANGEERVAFEPCNINGNLAIGAGGYNASEGNTMIYGNNIRLGMKEKVYINNTELDYIIEQTSNGTWFYRKWSSGRVELFGYQNIDNMPCQTDIGVWKRTAVITPPSFPFTVNNPHTVATYESEGYGALLWPTTLATEEKPYNYYLIRPLSNQGISGIVHFYVSGTWK